MTAEEFRKRFKEEQKIATHGNNENDFVKILKFGGDVFLGEDQDGIWEVHDYDQPDFADWEPWFPTIRTILSVTTSRTFLLANITKELAALEAGHYDIVVTITGVSQQPPFHSSIQEETREAAERV